MRVEGILRCSSVQPYLSSTPSPTRLIIQGCYPLTHSLLAQNHPPPYPADYFRLSVFPPDHHGFRWGEEDSSAALCKALSEWKTTTPSATVIPHDGGILLGMLQPVPSSSELHKAPCIEERTTVHHHAQPAVPIDCASGTPFVGKKGVPPGEVVDKMTPMAARESSPRVLFDFILAGDVLYKHSLVEPFLGTVQEMLAPNGRMLLCHVPRAGVTYKIVEEAFERAGLSFAVLASGKNDREAGGGGTNEERDVGGVELCMDDARRARLYSVTRTR